MSADYGSATIAGGGGVPYQTPIGYSALTAANPAMWNAHIGTKQAQPATAVENSLASGIEVVQGSPGRSKTNQPMTWCLCVAGCATSATGTITAGVFVAGAGSSIAQSTIPANGFGWVVN
jgi:hypothetical protein